MLAFFRATVHDLSRRPKGNIPALDLLRCVAILLVFGTHYAQEFGAAPHILRSPVFFWGWTGVDLFFVLSGFLIGTQLWKELLRSGKIHIGRFLIRRGLRIWPLYFAFVLLIAFEAMFGRGTSGLWADVFFLSNYFHHQIGGGWSLSTEEQFYVIAPSCICALVALGFSPRRHLWTFPVLWLVMVVCARAITIQHNASDLRDLLYFPVHSHSDGLAMGLLIAWAFAFWPAIVYSRQFRIAVISASVIGAITLYHLHRTLFNFTSLALICAAATTLAITQRRPPRFVYWTGFYVVSRLSYGVYLNHFGLLPLLRRMLGGTFSGTAGRRFWADYLLCLAASLGCALITFITVEQPFLQLRCRRIDSANAAPLGTRQMQEIAC